MAKPSYTFVDPNRPEAMEEVLRKILIEKLCAAGKERKETWFSAGDIGEGSSQ